MKKKRDHLATAALAMAIIGTASAEYQLAKDVGWGRMAFALPGALDIYVIRALRAHRDMLAAILAMFAVNAVSHLITVGLLSPSVWVVIGVSGIAPAVLWRVHALRDAVVEPAAEPMDDHFRAAAELTETARNLREVPAEPELVPVVIERVTERAEIPADRREFPTLGPMVPVAELLAGTGRDLGTQLLVRPNEKSPEPAEPGPEVPEPETGTSTGSAGVPAEHIEAVREWLAAEPELTGTKIGERLGTSDGYGRKVKRATLALETTS